MARNEQDAKGGIDFIAKLILLELPHPDRPEEVRSAFDDWLSAAFPGEDESISVQVLHPRAPSPSRGPNGEREEALITLLRLVLPMGMFWITIEKCTDLVVHLERIQRSLAPAEAVMAFLENEAAKIVSQFWEQNIRAPRRLRNFFEDSVSVSLEEETIRLPFGVSAPLGRAIDAEGLDGIDLWNLRSIFPNNIQAFDAAVSKRSTTVEPILSSAVIKLFAASDREPPSPIEFLAAFDQFLPIGSTIGLIISEIEDRITTTDGFDRGPDRAAWFDALSTLRGWRREHVRKLVYLDRDWTSLGPPALRALLHAMQEMAIGDRRSAAFSAFHAHRVARSMVEEGRALADSERLRMVEDQIRKLPGASDIAGLSVHIAALPLLIRSRNCVWNYCGKTTRAMWVDDVKAFAETDGELAQGLAEFLISFASSDALDEIERLVLELLQNAEGISLLEGMADELLDKPPGGMAYLAGMRARGLRRQMLA